MSTEHWHRVEALFTEASALAPGSREPFLSRRCGGDTQLRDEVASLLAAADQSAGFLATPALDVFARQISREGWSVQPGDRIHAYTVEARIGSGGMGEVWRARDERLGRDVAIKVLLPHPSDAVARVRAFEQEARAAGALNHPNVLTVHDVGEHRGAPYLVTECLEGEVLRDRLASGPLPVDAALDIALHVARGLGAAHARGIVHRDLKPENIFLVADGRVKILDFGLATLLGSPVRGADRAHDGPGGFVAGTAGYMAPEQMQGTAVDQRADIYSLGAVLFEMVTGARPFRSSRLPGALQPAESHDAGALMKACPPALRGLVDRCLAVAPDDRFGSMGELESALEQAIRARNPPAAPSPLTLLRRPAVLAVLAVAIVAIAAAGWRWRVQSGRTGWARTVAAPEAQRLADHGDFAAAFLLVKQALEVVPGDPQLERLWRDVSIPVAVTTQPEGAKVSFAPYGASESRWTVLGVTPIDAVRVPRTLIRVRATKAGFAPIDASATPPAIHFRLDPESEVPDGMVRVAGGEDAARFGVAIGFDDYWIDRYEVTNRQFKAFVDQGGYNRRDFWREPFVDGGRGVPWEEAMARFRDSTGQPGPATWAAGTYAADQADYPVGGVSWYEAAAFAAFAGRSLPTVHHWYRAAGRGRFAGILMTSNFGGAGPAPVGRHQGVGPFGTYDMAGNVKEWCSNETGGRRFLLGGGWDEPRYMFADYDAKDAFDRAPTYGFRLATYPQPLRAEVTAPVRPEAFGGVGRTQTPVSDEIFAVYRRQFAYDDGPLNATVEETDETARWMKQTVSIDAAYGGERMRVHVFLPRDAAPPYQTVVFFPAADAFRLRSSRDLSMAPAEFILRSGRAFIYPVYKGTYERGTGGEPGPNAQREQRIAWSRDLGRTLDYLQTRAEFDMTRVAFLGISSGGEAGVILTAIESRVMTSVLLGTGLVPDVPAEIDLLNYAPRVRVPTLMLNGRYDFESPFETAQRPLFQLLGAPAADKRHRTLETGHALPIDDVQREVLPWLDRYLGAVARR